MITFQQLRSGEFDPGYLKNKYELKRLSAKHTYNPDNPKRQTVNLRNDWSGNKFDVEKKKNVGLHLTRNST